MAVAVADLFGDQASGLRRLFGEESLQVVSLCAGCAGVGRSLVLANLAVALTRQGKNVLVLDENRGSEGVAACFGQLPRGDLLQVVENRLPLEAVILPMATGVRVLPAADLTRKLGRLSQGQQDALYEALTGMADPADIILIDAANAHPAGLSPMSLAASETVMVVAPQATSITEAYALMKKITLGHGPRRFRLLVSKARRPEEAFGIFENFSSLARDRLGITLDYAGQVPLDESLRLCANMAESVVTAHPEAPATRALRQVAGQFLRWADEAENGIRGRLGIEQFLQHLLNLSRRFPSSTVHAG